MRQSTKEVHYHNQSSHSPGAILFCICSNICLLLIFNIIQLSWVTRNCFGDTSAPVLVVDIFPSRVYLVVTCRRCIPLTAQRSGTFSYNSVKLVRQRNWQFLDLAALCLWIDCCYSRCWHDPWKLAPRQWRANKLWMDEFYVNTQAQWTKKSTFEETTDTAREDASRPAWMAQRRPRQSLQQTERRQ